MPYQDDDRTITEGARRFDLFVDRHDVCFRFLEYLNTNPHPDTILHLTGDPGNGKTMLLDVFGKKLAREIEPDNWTYLRGLDKDDCIQQVWDAGETAGRIPVARFDFGEDVPNTLSSLTSLRRKLPGIEFPRFELAAISYLAQSGELTQHSIATHFLAKDVPQLLEIAAAFGLGMPGQGFVAGVILGPLTKKLSDKRLRDKIGDDTVQRILELAELDDLNHYLPDFFAADLATALGRPTSPKAIVILIDTHEALVQTDPDLPALVLGNRDRWLRRLVLTSPRASGVIFVIGSRDRLHWTEAQNDRIPEDKIETHTVSELSDEDARTYLQAAGIEPLEAIELLIEDAQIAPDRVHPLMLGLGADLARLIQRNESRALTRADLALDPTATSRHVQIMQRFLSYAGPEVRNAIVAVSACRQFSHAVFDFLGARLNFGHTLAAFGLLRSFSFITQATVFSSGEEWQMHQLLKRAIWQSSPQEVIEAHEAMVAFYDQRLETDEDDDFARVEAVYHALECDQQTGIERWTAAFSFGVRRARYSSICEPLLGIVPRVESGHEFELGVVLRLSGEYHAVRSRHSEATDAFERAIAAYDAALANAPGHPEILNNKGNALQKRGDLEQRLNKTDDARASYTAAIAAYDAALANAPWHARARDNRHYASLARIRLACRAAPETVPALLVEWSAFHEACASDSSIDEPMDEWADLIRRLSTAPDPCSALEDLFAEAESVERHSSASDQPM